MYVHFRSRIPQHRSAGWLRAVERNRPVPSQHLRDEAGHTWRLSALEAHVT
jgi:hypothetical protein